MKVKHIFVRSAFLILLVAGQNAFGQKALDTLDSGFERVLPDIIANSIDIQEITFFHALRNNQLPFHHRDPFDRMIAAQALVEEIDLVSSDEVFDRYFEGSGVKRIW